MQIISHRGYWKTEGEKNSPCAFERSFRLGFGTETDFRDLDGELVISHDPATRGALPVREFLAMHSAFDPALPLAINIKADGLQKLLRALLEEFAVQDYFLFDMSVPDAIQSAKAGLRIFTRQSDVELEPTLYAESAGVWMDAFYDESWLVPEKIAGHLDAGRQVCLVSPELHRRPPVHFWSRLRASGLTAHPDLILCTDIPEEAVGYFGK